MELVSPGIGLLFWMLLSFFTVLFILKKFAWKPILKALKNREESIGAALSAADKAKLEMEKLKAENEKILQEARKERENLLKDARETREKIIAESRDLARKEAEKLKEDARIGIENEKAAAIHEIKEMVASLSVDIAEKILKQKLADSKEQKALLDKMLDDIKLN